MQVGFPVHIVGEAIDWPAWVQAIGSILAIIFAVLVQRKTALEADADRYSALEGVFTFAYEAIREYAVAWESWLSGSLTEALRSQKRVFADGLLRQVPTFQLGNPIMAALVRDMRDQLSEVSEGGWLSPDRVGDAQTVNLTTKIRDAAERARGHEVLVRASAEKKRRRARLWWIPGI